jgi:hypothetical protein
MLRLLLALTLFAFSGCAEHAANLQTASDEDLFRELSTFSPLLPEGRHQVVREELRRRHPGWNWADIDQGKVAKGMGKEEVILSWGDPHRVNKSTYGEQWVYHRSGEDRSTDYLHFENGILTDTD